MNNTAWSLWRGRQPISRRQQLDSRFRLMVEELENRLAPATTYAVFGDYGFAGQNEADVAALVNSWNPDYVLTVGDNNYPDGEAATIDANIGQYYSNYIFPYVGGYGSTATVNRFFPAIGDEDFNPTAGYQPYLDYFTLPNNERYYKVTLGEVEFFILNSDANEPDGRSAASVQAAWLEDELAASSATWQIVVTHHAPYSSAKASNSGGTTATRWDYEEWGADAVLSGHYHQYERLNIDGLPYFVTGLGGRSKNGFADTPVSGSELRYNADFGAMLITADETKVNFQFINVDGIVIDNYTLALGGFPTVSVAATDASASEAGSDDGIFRITRTGSTASELIVNYTMGGSASNGVDYAMLSGSVAIPIGASFADIVIDPVNDSLPEGLEVVSITLSPSSNYNINAAMTDVLTLDDNDATWLVPVDSTWKYLDDGSNQGTAWRDSGFNDSAWASGAAELGYGDGDEATEVGFGPDPNNTYITTYFRHAFNVANPAQFSGLTLSLLRDDGAVVYLNGVEIFRSNMPSGTIGYTTLASSAIAGAGEITYHSVAVNPSLLASGTNVLAVEIHQSSAGSSDISFNLKLLGEFTLPKVTLAIPDASAAEASQAGGLFRITRTGSTASDLTVFYTVAGSAANGVDYTALSGSAIIPAGSASIDVPITPVNDTLAEGDEKVMMTLSANSAYTLGNKIKGTVNLIDDEAKWLVAAGSTWKYLDDGSNQGTAWRNLGFDDSSWSSGKAQLGYGEGDEKTVVGFGPDANNKYVTTYFRQTFNITDPAQYTALALSLLRDDGAVVYLNGVEVFRSNMPSGTISFTTLASTDVTGTNETKFFKVNLSPSLLVSGTNILAVELHQHSPSSDDLSFNLKLLGTLAQTVTIAATDPNAAEQGSENGFFTISRAGSTAAALTVNYTVSGSATNGIDYQALSGTAVIPAGAASVTVIVNPVNDSNAEGEEKAVVTLAADAAYVLGTKKTASVTIVDDEATWLVAAGANWKYLDDGSNQGTAWRESGFDDSSWSSGNAQLGYGDGDENTTVGFGPDANNKYITTYFRYTFDVADASLFSDLALSLMRDDGAVVYLNGVEIFRSNMPGGQITYTTLASSVVDGTNESKFIKVNLDPGALLNGTNVLAVELHQASATSDDISFNLKLLGTYAA